MSGKKTEKSNEKNIKIKLIRSYYGCKEDQIRTLRALGLTRLNQVKEHKETPSIKGMVFKVKHLVEIL